MGEARKGACRLWGSVRCLGVQGGCGTMERHVALLSFFHHDNEIRMQLVALHPRSS